MAVTESPALLIGIQEAARLLMISDRTLFTLTKSGAIPVVKMGKSVRYRRSDLEAFVERSVLNPAV